MFLGQKLIYEYVLKFQTEFFLLKQNHKILHVLPINYLLYTQLYKQLLTQQLHDQSQRSPHATDIRTVIIF